MPTRCTNRRTKQSLPLTKPRSSRNPCDPVFQQRQGGSRIHPLLLPRVKAKPAYDSISTHRSCTGPVHSQHPCQAAHSLLPLYLWGVSTSGVSDGSMDACTHAHITTQRQTYTSLKIIKMEKISCTLK